MTKISKSELELMHLIWESESPVTCGELLARLPKGRAWKNTTVLTFLSRLADKGMLQVEKRGKSNRYRAAVTEAEYRAQETASFLSDIHGGSVKSFIAALGDCNGLSPDELEELRDWLSKR